MLSCDTDDVVTPPPPDPVETETPRDTLTAGWSQQKISDKLLVDIFFKDAQIGYTGGDYLYKTNDGGSTWIKFSDSNQIANIFVTPDGALNTINVQANQFKKFTNWGQSSTTIQLSGWSSYSGDLYFTSINNGFLITGDALFTTTDGGSKWNKVINATGLTFISPTTYSALCFLDSVTGWVSNGKKIFKTNGSVMDWISCNVPASLTASFSSIQAVSANVIYAATLSGDILKSTDGGNNFNTVGHLGTIQSHYFNDIHFLDVLNGYACYNNRIFQTNDGGVTWNKVVSVADSQIIEIHFIDANHGWACTFDGRVLRYVN